jgi:hypothetical protein
VAGFGLTPAVETRLKCLWRTVDEDSGQLLRKILQDLHSADRAKADRQKNLRQLVGSRVIENGEETFPRHADPHDIDKQWEALRNFVQNAFGLNALGPDLKAFDAGYIAARVDDLSKNCPDSKLGLPKQFLKEIAPHVESSLAAQAVVCALLYWWLFAEPESMCSEVYSEKEVKLLHIWMLNGKFLVTMPKHQT